ncbi:MAG: hypothetical protein AAB915_00630 [Patescibacteria group bacterium]
MAKNPPKGAGRAGVVKNRDQVLNTRNKRWTKRVSETGRFADQKADWAPFKGVRKIK